MLTVKYLSTESIKPYKDNSRAHTQKQINQIADSIKQFGFLIPITIDESKTIVAGHGRLMAAELLGHKKVPTITVNGLTDIQKRAYVIADNKLTLNSDWNLDKLKLELNDLLALNFDVDVIGFESSELGEILGGWDSDLDLPSPTPSDKVKITITCNVFDKEEALQIAHNAFEQSNLEDFLING